MLEPKKDTWATEVFLLEEAKKWKMLYKLSTSINITNINGKFKDVLFLFYQAFLVGFMDASEKFITEHV